MSHGFETGPAVIPSIKTSNPLILLLSLILTKLNGIILFFSQIALVAAGLVLSYSVGARYLFRQPTYWQDEAAVFLLVGATFLSAAHVQSLRGHIGIEALTGYLSPRLNRIRLVCVDITSCLFCAFFAWKSWALMHEAYIDGQVSSSTWAPPLSIPYGIMAIGMTLLALQIFLQITVALGNTQKNPGDAR